MNIELNADIGDGVQSPYPQPMDIDLNVLRRIILAGHQKLDNELADDIEFVKTAENAEEYDTVWEILEGAYIEGKLIIQAAKEAERLHIWIDSLTRTEQEAQ